MRILKLVCAGMILASAAALGQTMTTYTGTIKDLAQQVVTTGQVTFTLAPPTDSTVPGVGRFTPSTTNCNINPDGTLSGYVAGVVSGACRVTKNTALSPGGTSYRICIQPQYATPGSCLYDYALQDTKDISTIAPTLSTGPINYGGIPGTPGPPGPPLDFVGPWNSTFTYSLGQTVSYNGVVYVSLLQPNLNNNPASNPSDWSSIYVPLPVQGLLVNVATYSGADICAKINAAALANPGLILDARPFSGNQACASNPFTTTTHDVVVLFNNVNIQTTAPWVTQSAGNALIYGAGRGGNGRGTTIQAVAGFPATCDGLTTGCPLLRLGSGATTFAHRIENLTLDCNSVSGCIGLYSTDINEQSGAIHFAVLNFSNIGILIDGSGANSAGPFFSQNYSLSDGEVYALNSAISTTIGVELIGGNAATSSGSTSPRFIDNITSSGSVAHPLASAYIFDSFTGGTVTNLNAEMSGTGYMFSNTLPDQGTTGSNLRCASVVNTCVWAKAISPFTNNLTLIGIQNTPTVATVTIKDDLNLANVTDPTVGLYISGQGFSSGGQTILTTASSVASTLPSLALNNHADLPQVLFLNSGLTAAQGVTVNFADRGVSKWIVQNNTLNEFQIRDQANSLTRLYFNSVGAAYLNARGTQPVGFNQQANSSTGGVFFCSGGAIPTCPASVNAAGLFTGSAVDVPIYKAGGVAGFSGSKVAGACTFTISSGIITSVTGC